MRVENGLRVKRIAMSKLWSIVAEAFVDWMSPEENRL